MFPKRRVNALTPIFASLDREEEDLSLPAKIPIKHVHNSTQSLQTCEILLTRRLALSSLLQQQLHAYRKATKKTDKLKFAAKSTKQQTIEAELEGIDSYAPFAPSNHNPFASELDDLAFSFAVSTLVYGKQIQNIANSYQVVIALRQPNRAGQKLLLENFPHAHLCAIQPSEVGVTAGFYPLELAFCAASFEHTRKQQQQMTILLDNDFKAIPLMLSDALIKNAIHYAQLKHIKAELYSAIYYGRQYFFTIKAPEYIVYQSHNKKVVEVLACNQEEQSWPLTSCYQLSQIIARKNTPSQMLAMKNTLVDAVTAALNTQTQRENFFQFELQAQQAASELYFIPYQQPRRLTNACNRMALLQKLAEHGYE